MCALKREYNSVCALFFQLETRPKGFFLCVFRALRHYIAVRAVQVEHIRLTLVLKALGCQPVEGTSSFKVMVSDGSTCPPTARSRFAPVSAGLLGREWSGQFLF